MPAFDPNPERHSADDQPLRLPGAFKLDRELARQLLEHVLSIPLADLELPQVRRVIKQHADELVDVGFPASAQNIVETFSAAFMHPAKPAEWSVNAQEHSIAEPDETLHKVLTVARKLSGALAGDELPAALDQALKSIAIQAARPRSAALQILFEISPILNSLKEWNDAFRHLGDSNRIESAELALKRLRGWTNPDQSREPFHARAELLNFILRCGPFGNEALVEFGGLRDSMSTISGDQTRVALLRSELGHYSRYPNSVVRALHTIQRLESVSGVAIAEIVKSYEHHNRAIKTFLFSVDSLPCADSKGRTNAQRHFIDTTLQLKNLGISTSLFAPPLIEFFAKEVQAHPEALASLAKLSAALSKFNSRAGKEGHDESGRSKRTIALLERMKETLYAEPIVEKLTQILDGRNLPYKHRLNTFGELEFASRQLHVQHYIVNALHSSGIEQFNYEDALVKQGIATADNPPFSTRADITPEAVMHQFVHEIRHGFRRTLDGYFGFWSQKFPMQRMPVSQRCYVDEMAKAVGATVIEIPTDNPNHFPGRGRIIIGVKKDLVFSIDPNDAHRDPFHRWKKDLLSVMGPIPNSRRAGNVHALDDLEDTRFMYLRGMRAVTTQVNQFFKIEGEHLSYVEYNEHFESSGCHVAYLVPTRVLNSFFSEEALSRKDLTRNPPTPANLAERCKEVNTAIGLVHVASGSNYNGGYCNGFEPHSEPFHGWENDNFGADAFFHAHKWFIRDHRDLLHRLHELHREIYEITISYTNRLDLMKIVDARYAWGLVNEAAPSAQNEMDFFGGELNEFSTVDPIELTDRTSSDIMGSDGEYFDAPWRLRTLRMLEWAAEQMFECRSAGVTEEKTPVLALQSIYLQSVPTVSPFIIDTNSGIVWRRGREPLIFDRLDGSVPDDVRTWWLEDVAPLCYKMSVLPRMLPRELYAEQLKNLQSQSGAH